MVSEIAAHHRVADDHLQHSLAKPQYDILVSDTAIASDWDDFLARTPGGHHVQTSMWLLQQSICRLLSSSRRSAAPSCCWL